MRDRLFIGWAAVASLILGALGFFPCCGAYGEEIACGYLCAAWSLALGLGIVAWRHLSGKVAVIGPFVLAFCAWRNLPPENAVQADEPPTAETRGSYRSHSRLRRGISGRSDPMGELCGSVHRLAAHERYHVR